MEEPQSVKILEVCRVAPPPEKPNSVPNSFPLNFFDLIWLRSAPAKRLFFYEISSATASEDFSYDSIIPKLKHSLSLALHLFRPLTGSLTWPQDSPKPIFTYLDDGVSLTIAESNAIEFYHQSSNDFHKATHCYSLIPKLEVSPERASAMALQITLFPSSGFCIGITTHHALLDGRSSTSFVKSWAHICNAGADSPSLLPELIPSFDRTLIKDNAGTEAILLNNLLKQQEGVPNNRSLMVSENKVGPGSVRGTFELSRQNFEKLRKSAKVESQHPLRISTFSLTCGYIWVCLLKSVETAAKGKKSFFGFAADCRSRLEPPIPATYLGNCLGGSMFAADTESLLGEDGLTAAAVAISEEIRKLNGGLFKESSPPSRSDAEPENPENQIVFAVSGSPQFDVYGVDFGWGKPRKVMMASLNMGETIGISDTSSRGVQIELLLPKEEMETFASLFAKGLEAL